MISKIFEYLRYFNIFKYLINILVVPTFEESEEYVSIIQASFTQKFDSARIDPGISGCPSGCACFFKYFYAISFYSM